MYKRQAIVDGKLLPYTRLKINDLSDELGISRTPVREAILMLENEGLVISKANKWTVVAPIRVERVKDIYPLIYELESFALRENFSKVNDKLIDDLIKINEEIKISHKENNYIKVLELDNKFHEKIINLSDNKEILPIIRSLKKRLKRYEVCFYKVKDKKINPSTYDEHIVIIENLKQRNLEKTLNALKKNWTTTLSDKSIDKISKLINVER